MKTTIDHAGRVVIPKRIREEAGLKAGTEVTVHLRDGRIELEPAPLRIKLVRKGRLLVAKPEHPLPPLTDEIVERTRQRVRSERI